MILNWIEFVPGWLGPTAVVIGLLLATVGLFRSGLDRLFSGVDSRFEYVLPAVAGLIYIWAMTNLLTLPAYVVRYPTGYAVLFAFSAKWIEGSSAVIILPKLSYVLDNPREVIRTRSLPGQSTLTRTAKRRVVLFFLGIMASYAFIGALLFQQGLPIPAGGPLVVAWTVLTFTISILGLVWKVSTVELPPYLLYGTILVLSGAEVVNLASIAGDIRVFLAGGLGYTLGYLTLLGLWLVPGDTLTAPSRDRR
jgi:hypothetical protein